MKVHVSGSPKSEAACFFFLGSSFQSSSLDSLQREARGGEMAATLKDIFGKILGKVRRIAPTKLP
jgi:hypothetical protein